MVITDTLVSVPPFAEDPTWGPGKGWNASFQYSVQQHKKRCESLAQMQNSIDRRYDLYTILSDLLTDPVHSRLVLYIPFYLVPSANNYRQVDDSVDRFIECYMNAWHDQLKDVDIRADFVDGDIPDITYQHEVDMPMVIQAAHIAPILYEKDLICKTDLRTMNDRLHQDFTDAFDPDFDPTDFPRPEKMTEQRAKWLKWSKKQDTNDKYPFTPNQTSSLHDNLMPIRRRIDNIGEKILNPALDRYIERCYIVFGSQLKGYGRPSGDVDIAVFKKHDVEEDITELLERHLGFRPYQFRLQRRDHASNICYPGPDERPDYGHSYDTHVLFNGVWEGDYQEIYDIKNTLYPSYFIRDDWSERGLWYRQMERDLLLYRFLHRGYAQYNKVQHNWTFMDEGWRKAALQLYLRYVFIPELYITHEHHAHIDGPTAV